MSRHGIVESSTLSPSGVSVLSSKIQYSFLSESIVSLEAIQEEFHTNDCLTFLPIASYSTGFGAF